MDEFQYSATNVYDMDETGISIVLSKMPEILSVKTKTNKKCNASRTWINTYVISINAGG